MSFNNKLNHLIPGNIIRVGRDEMVVTTRHISDRWGLYYELFDTQSAETYTMWAIWTGTDHYYDLIDAHVDLFSSEDDCLHSNPNVFQLFEGLVLDDPRDEEAIELANSITEEFEVVA